VALRLALGVVVVLLASCGASGVDQQQLLDKVVETGGAPGVLGLVRSQRETWQGASGLADVGSARPMRADVRFRAGSVTKTFVAVVVLQLVAEGRIRLDERVAGQARVRDLLAHTSGIADLVDLPGVMERHWNPQELVSTALAQPRIFWAPGSRFAYSSTNYAILGLLVESRTRHTLREEIAARILRPLALRRTGFRLTRADAHGYVPAVRDGIVQEHPGRDTWGADASWAWASGDLVSSARDLMRFYKALLRGRLLPQSLLKVMLTPAVERPNRLRYGFGIAIIRTRCGLAYGHTGNVLGYVSAVWNDRDARRQVVVMANAFPLGTDADQALRNALERAFCAD
jgi:D-alanyl-D-alanine carboxypeptidase